jgi:hypothetical protein
MVALAKESTVSDGSFPCFLVSAAKNREISQPFESHSPALHLEIESTRSYLEFAHQSMTRRGVAAKISAVPVIDLVIPIRTAARRMS